ncbi:MAG: FISUMP domain-containing protein [Bacteroidota bacterium]
MKKTTLMFFLTLAFLQTQAQDYLISFAGTGANTSVGSVQVDNLTRMTTVTLNGTDILHLNASLGIEDQVIHNNVLHIYPNPMAEESMLTFDAPDNGNAAIGIVDLSGKTVYQMNAVLSAGTHSFRVTGIREGMCLLKITGKNYFYSAKLISQGKPECAARMEYVASDQINLSKQFKSTAATIDMQYNEGDQLLFKGISGIYSTIVTDVPVSSKTLTFNFAECTDADNNNYSIVQIGSQTWMAENLNVGARINGLSDQTNNSIIEKYCNDDNDSNCVVYGGIYQWDEAMQYSTIQGIQGICPTGWHFPTDGEWTTLTTNLGNDNEAAQMKETGTTHWLSPNTDATNSSGFTALPGGFRDLYGTFGGIGSFGRWGSSTEYDIYESYYWDLDYSNYVFRNNWFKDSGFSVRCLKDN